MVWINWENYGMDWIEMDWKIGMEDEKNTFINQFIEKNRIINLFI